MKRGILTLSTQESNYLYTLLQDNNSVPTSLNQKFTTQENASQKVQISEEDAETILDLLPVPQNNEEEIITTTRKSVQSFLTQLRF